MPAPVDAPEHLPQPSVAEMDLPTVMDALSDPIRLAILHRYLVDAAGGVRSCGWVGIDRPKSTLTHHFRVLREAGLLEQHQEGLTRSSRVRFDEVQQRFPGLLDLVFAWEVPAALMRADLRADVREDLRADLRAERSEDVTA